MYIAVLHAKKQFVCYLLLYIYKLLYIVAPHAIKFDIKRYIHATLDTQESFQGFNLNLHIIAVLYQGAQPKVESTTDDVAFNAFRNLIVYQLFIERQLHSWVELWRRAFLWGYYNRKYYVELLRRCQMGFFTNTIQAKSKISRRKSLPTWHVVGCSYFMIFYLRKQ